MINIAIQPCGDSDANQHYVDTILNPVKFSDIRSFLNFDQIELMVIIKLLKKLTNYKRILHYLIESV